MPYNFDLLSILLYNTAASDHLKGASTMIEKLRKEWEQSTSLDQAFGVSIVVLIILTLIASPLEATHNPFSLITTPLFQACFALVAALAWVRLLEKFRERRELVRIGVRIYQHEQFEEWITFALALIATGCALSVLVF